MTTTANTEHEAFRLVIERQKSGASESDIRFAFQRFMEIAGIAPASGYPPKHLCGSDGHRNRLD